MKIITALSALALSTPAFGSIFAQINEFHYDNDGADAGEFVEIVTESGLSIDGMLLTLYNGNGGASYNEIALSDFDDHGVLSDGLHYYSLFISGIQNGSPDGMALSMDPLGLGVGNNSVIEFLSYEGTFDATNGVAAGMTSTDIGVSQGGGTPEGSSLQRLNTAGGAASNLPTNALISYLDDFGSKEGPAPTWAATDGFNTKGDINMVPAPGALALLGLAAVAASRRRRK